MSSMPKVAVLPHSTSIKKSTRQELWLPKGIRLAFAVKSVAKLADAEGVVVVFDPTAVVRRRR